MGWGEREKKANQKQTLNYREQTDHAGVGKSKGIKSTLTLISTE